MAVVQRCVAQLPDPATPARTSTSPTAALPGETRSTTWRCETSTDVARPRLLANAIFPGTPHTECPSEPGVWTNVPNLDLTVTGTGRPVLILLEIYRRDADDNGIWWGGISIDEVEDVNVAGFTAHDRVTVTMPHLITLEKDRE